MTLVNLCIFGIATVAIHLLLFQLGYFNTQRFDLDTLVCDDEDEGNELFGCHDAILRV